MGERRHHRHHRSREPFELDQYIYSDRCGRKHYHMSDIQKFVGETVHSVPFEKNSQGLPIPGLPEAANVQYSVDAPSIGQLTQNTDGSADVLGVAAGTVNLSWVDKSESLPASVKQIVFAVNNVPEALDQTLS